MGRIAAEYVEAFHCELEGTEPAPAPAPYGAKD